MIVTKSPTPKSPIPTPKSPIFTPKSPIFTPKRLIFTPKSLISSIGYVDLFSHQISIDDLFLHSGLMWNPRKTTWNIPSRNNKQTLSGSYLSEIQGVTTISLEICTYKCKHILSHHINDTGVAVDMQQQEHIDVTVSYYLCIGVGI